MILFLKKHLYFTPKLGPILLAFLTVAIFCSLLSFNQAYGFIGRFIGVSPTLGSRQRVQLNVLSYSPETNRKLVLIGGSQILQGFEDPRVLEDLYYQKYQEKLEIIDLGYNTQTIAESLMILTNLALDKNTLVALHASPTRLKKADIPTCEDSSILSLYSSDFVNLIGGSKNTSCRIRDVGNRFFILIASTILKSKQYFRVLFETDMEQPTAGKTFKSEQEFVKDPILYVRNVVAEKIRRTKARLSRKDKQPSKIAPDVEKKPNVFDIEGLFAATREYVDLKKGRLFLVELPWNEDFYSTDSPFHPSFHTNDPDIHKWLLTKMKSSANLGRLNQSYYDKIEQTKIDFVSFREPIYTGNDFYDSMHLTQYGREKFTPRFLNWAHQQFNDMRKAK